MTEERKEVLKNGQIILLQGQVPVDFVMLHSGSVEILGASDEYNGLGSDIIISKSHRVAVIKTNGLISGLNSTPDQPYRKSLRAAGEVTVSRIPFSGGSFQSMAAADPMTIVNILRQLYSRSSVSISESGKLGKLFQNISMISDNLSLIYKEISQSNAAEELHSRAEMLHGNFSSSGGNLPEQFTARFLVTDNSRFLSRRYEIPGESLDSINRGEMAEFMKKLLRLPPKITGTMVRTDPAIAIDMYRMMADVYLKVLDRIDTAAESIDRELGNLFGESASWSEYLVAGNGLKEWNASGRLSPDFLKNFLSLLVKINGLYEEMMGCKMTAICPGIRQIHQCFTTQKAQPVGSSSSGTVEAAVGRAPAVKKAALVTGYNQSMQQIFEFAMVEKETQKQMLKLLNDFKNSKNPFNTESDGRKLRRQIARLYWGIYKQAYIRAKSEAKIPKPVQLMLRFGFFDEDLIEPEQLQELNDLIRSNETSEEFPILYEEEFLSLIYDQAEMPSITEMGLSYEAHLREEEKHKSRKDRKKEQVVDENIKKTIYEIEQRLASTAAVCSGSTSTAFPILTSHAIKGSLSGLYVSKKKIEDLVQGLRKVDFSAFYRETVLKMGDAREIVKEEILPYIILLPVFGTRTLLWQELSGTNKRTRGRIVVPIFFLGDLKKNLAHTIACFRWELNRTMKGAMWADPIEGGVTGEFFDYVNTYKKNSNLSAEAKEKIKEKFRSLRTNRDRFAEDYMMWVMFEKDGIMKLNAVVREMFFKHIPFPHALRERLENMPAFTKYATRYKNISKKNMEAYERRFKKYQNKDGELPPEISHFLEFMKW